MIDLEKITKQRERILEMIILMSDITTPLLLRQSYHDRCLIVLEDYQGKDFNELMDKYLQAEWKL